jgi:hypothetical protein
VAEREVLTAALGVACLGVVVFAAGEGAPLPADLGVMLAARGVTARGDFADDAIVGRVRFDRPRAGTSIFLVGVL